MSRYNRTCMNVVNKIDGSYIKNISNKSSPNHILTFEQLIGLKLALRSVSCWASPIGSGSKLDTNDKYFHLTRKLYLQIGANLVNLLSYFYVYFNSFYLVLIFSLTESALFFLEECWELQVEDFPQRK